MKVGNRFLQRTMVECLLQAPILSSLPSSNVILDSFVQVSTRVFSGFSTNIIGDRQEDVRQEPKDRGNCSISSSKAIEDFHCPEVSSSRESPDGLNPKDLSQDSLAQISSLRMAFKENGIPVPILEAVLQGKRYGFTADFVGHVLRSVMNDWESALRIFLWIRQQPGYRHSPETLDLMIHILGKAYQYQVMWELIGEMKNANLFIRPKTLDIIIQSYVKTGKLEYLVDAFERMKDFDHGMCTTAFNILVRILCYEKRVEDCQLIFDRLKDMCLPDEKTYSILIHGLCSLNRMTDALKVLDEMIQVGIQPTWGAYTSLIEILCAKDKVDVAKKLFYHMKNSILCHLKETNETTKTSQDLGILNEIPSTLDFAAYNCLITSLCRLGEVDDACQLLERMVSQGFTPYAKTYSIVFEQLCKTRKPKEAFELYNSVAGTVFFQSFQIHDNLIEMFCSTGHVDMALDLWGKIQEEGYSGGRQSYTVLIHGLCYNALFTEAFEFFKEMIEKGIVPLYQTYKMLHFGLLKDHNMEKFDELKEIVKQLEERGIWLVTRRKQ